MCLLTRSPFVSADFHTGLPGGWWMVPVIHATRPSLIFSFSCVDTRHISPIVVLLDAVHQLWKIVPSDWASKWDFRKIIAPAMVVEYSQYLVITRTSLRVKRRRPRSGRVIVWRPMQTNNRNWSLSSLCAVDLGIAVFSRWSPFLLFNFGRIYSLFTIDEILCIPPMWHVCVWGLCEAECQETKTFFWRRTLGPRM